jgi:hypothetical protein
MGQHRVRALSFAILSLAYLGRAAGFAAADLRWGLVDLALAATLVAIAAGLWAGSRSVRFLALGIAGNELIQWMTLGLRLATHGEGPPQAHTWAMTCGAFTFANIAAIVSCWTWPERSERRHALALVLTGAALHGGFLFAATPGQPSLVTGAVIVGTAGLVAGSIGLGWGRTWGLLLVFASALLLMVGVGSAPDVSALSGSHPWFPGRALANVRGAGVLSAILGAAAASLYFGPMIRFLRRAG